MADDRSAELERRAYRILNDRRRVELVWTDQRYGTEWVDLEIAASKFEPGVVAVRAHGTDPILIENLESLEGFLRDVRLLPPSFAFAEHPRPCPSCDASGDAHENWCEFVETT